MALETFKAVTTHPGQGLQVKVQTRHHEFIVDEPEELAGSDTGANPVELILGALGACQSIVAQIYAKQFGIEFDELRIELEGDLDLGGFLGRSDARPGYQQIRYNYIIQTQAPKEKLDAWFEHVNTHCPVGDTLENGTQLVAAGYKIEAPDTESA